MNIAIIDAELNRKDNHRFPNLACMKLSAYYKEQGNTVVLKQDYENLSDYDKVFISKVFTETEVPDGILKLSNVEYGGTGFFYEKAVPLPEYIEHIRPDYDLYSGWVQSELEHGRKKSYLKHYMEWSIGFTTRGCIRRCSFCVNQNSTVCRLHSPISEFVDESRKYICLLDDNVFACKDWRRVFSDLQESGKSFQFKQGLDLRLLDEEKAKVLAESKIYECIYFAFDNIKDRTMIEKKLQVLRYYTDKRVKLYLFCGYNHDTPHQYTDEFWLKDIIDLLERIRILFSYQCMPYVMRYSDYKKSPYVKLYTHIANWINFPSACQKISLREYKTFKPYTKTELDQFEKIHPEIAEKYFDMKWSDYIKK